MLAVTALDACKGSHQMDVTSLSLQQAMQCLALAYAANRSIRRGTRQKRRGGEDNECVQEGLCRGLPVERRLAMKSAASSAQTPCTCHSGKPRIPVHTAVLPHPAPGGMLGSRSQERLRYTV